MKFIKMCIIAVTLVAASLLSIPATAVTNQSGVGIKKTHSDTSLHIKFTDSDEVSLKGGTFISTNGNNLQSINELLADSRVAKKARLMGVSAEDVSAQRRQLKAENATIVPNMNNYYRITVAPGVDSAELIESLKRSPLVEEAYAEPLPAPSPVSPNYGSLQTHFSKAPTGMGVTASAVYPGASGSRIRIADLEYSWNTAHEDVSDARASDARISNGTAVDPFNDTNHGTAVAGIISGDKNTYGITGIIPDAKLHLVATNTVERGWDVANAIYTAQYAMSAGDVMLIEQQVWGLPGRGYLPVEWVPAAYSAIKTATAKGVIVVEAAGNGSENLDDPAYGTPFPLGKSDSGAIMVGAGAACNGTTQHSRMYFSNYGNRVNVQGYGECVVTSGYGWLYNAGGMNAWYTNGFSGTSSASALVASVAGSLSSAYEHQKGTNLTPQQVRNALVTTGTPQYTAVMPGKIGPLPNLEAALKKMTPLVDTTAPTTPTNFKATLQSATTVGLTWNASTDNSNSVRYRVFRNGVLIATTSNRYYTDSGLARWTWYSYKVRAVDPTGNVSAFTPTISVRTN